MEFTANYRNASVKIFDSIEEMALAFFNLVSEEIVASITSGKDYHLCLSGGSTPLKIFGFLRKLPLNEMNLDYLHLYWGDERCVPPDHKESNYGNAWKTIIDFMNIPPANIHRIKGENSPEKESKRYEMELMANVPLSRGIPSFDLLLLGIGDDGHTASIFPGQDHIIESKRLVMPSVNPANGQSRITLTPRIINNSGNIIFLVTGSSKASVVNEVLNRSGSFANYPAHKIHPESGNIHWFMDAESSALL